MHILITNDDGKPATGINVLTEKLAEVTDVPVVVPERGYCGVGNAPKQGIVLVAPLQQWLDAP